MDGYARFIKQQVSSRLYRPGGTVETMQAPAVWTPAHRGYSGSGRLDVWVYATKREALYEGARLALACGLDEDELAWRDFAAGRHQKVLDRYEETHPETHLLRVQTTFLQFPDRRRALGHTRARHLTPARCAERPKALPGRV